MLVFTCSVFPLPCAAMNTCLVSAHHGETVGQAGTFPVTNEEVPNASIQFGPLIFEG